MKTKIKNLTASEIAEYSISYHDIKLNFASKLQKQNLRYRKSIENSNDLKFEYETAQMEVDKAQMALNDAIRWLPIVKQACEYSKDKTKIEVSKLHAISLEFEKAKNQEQSFLETLKEINHGS